jgi:hypothetical protein
MKITIENETVAHQPARTDQIPTGSVPDMIDFFEVRHQLMLGHREIDDTKEVDATGVKGKREHGSSLTLADSVETAVYWFVAAPALLYLIYLVVRPLIGVMP